jgi:hypothetical protein
LSLGCVVNSREGQGQFRGIQAGIRELGHFLIGYRSAQLARLRVNDLRRRCVDLDGLRSR